MLLMDSSLVVFYNESCWFRLGHVINICFCDGGVGGGDCDVYFVGGGGEDGDDFFHRLSSCDKLITIS